MRAALGAGGARTVADSGGGKVNRHCINLSNCPDRAAPVGQAGAGRLSPIAPPLNRGRGRDRPRQDQARRSPE